MPRGLVVVLAGTGLLVSVLALRQFASILEPVLLAVILVIGVHPLTGILRRCRAPMWPAATVTLIALVAVILGLAAVVGAIRRPVVRRAMGQRDRDLGRRLAEPVRFTETLGLSATFLAALGPARVTPSSPAPTPELVPH